MTNLLEKILLTGFGILILIFFFSFINPFILQFFEVNEYYNSEITPYLKIIDEVNYGISYVHENEETQYLRTINYPEDLNITILEHNIKFQFLFNSDIKYRIYEYPIGFYSQNYILLSPKDYTLNISFCESLIKVLIY